MAGGTSPDSEMRDATGTGAMHVDLGSAGIQPSQQNLRVREEAGAQPSRPRLAGETATEVPEQEFTAALGVVQRHLAAQQATPQAEQQAPEVGEAELEAPLRLQEGLGEPFGAPPQHLQGHLFKPSPPRWGPAWTFRRPGRSHSSPRSPEPEKAQVPRATSFR